MRVGRLVKGTEWHPGRGHGVGRPVVSVLLPTYRRGASGLLFRAARSVLGQDLRDLELIVVDDGSTDGTAEQIAQLMREDGRVHCLRHPRNVGLPAISEFEAFRRARGDYFAFAFDDDEFDPAALGRLLRHARGGDQPFVHGYVELYKAGAATGGALVRQPDFGRGPTPQVLLRSANHIPNNAVLVHRRVLETVGLYDPHVCLARYCDWDLWRRVAERFPITAVEVPVGRQWGPATGDSYSDSYPLEPWTAVEWMSRPRDASLRPEAFEDYDVLAVPASLSTHARTVVAELTCHWSTRAWYAERAAGDAAAEHAAAGDASATAVPPDPCVPDGAILVLTDRYDAPIRLAFDSLPGAWASRVRVVFSGHYHGHLQDELVGASAVVFARNLEHFAPLVACARDLGVPHYFFTDEDPLAGVPGERAAAVARLRAALQSFEGVLVAGRALLDPFAAEGIHPSLAPVPPIAPVLEQMLRRHGAVGLLARDVRYRRALARPRHPEVLTPPFTELDGRPVLPVPVFESMTYRLRAPGPRLSWVCAPVAPWDQPASGYLRLTIAEPATRAVLREVAARVDHLWNLSRVRFAFAPLAGVAGQELLLRLAAETDHRIALFESSTACKAPWRRMLRKVGLDRRGEDLCCTLG